MSTGLLIAIGVCVFVVVFGLIITRRKKVEFPPFLTGTMPMPPEPTPDETKGVEENLDVYETPTTPVETPVVLCNNWSATIEQSDILNATGNVDEFRNNRLFLNYATCDNKLSTVYFTSAGLHVDAICALNTIPPSLYYFQNDFPIYIMPSKLIKEEKICEAGESNGSEDSTPLGCYKWNVTISNYDILNATGNSDSTKDYRLFLNYATCDNLLSMMAFTTEGLHSNALCASNQMTPILYYYQNDIPVHTIDSIIEVTEEKC